ncbi:MAG: hypothetical protein R2798_08480 [Chitinophagales bacterium]|nr:hypothetical protein [Bacteroidota bacterium]MCB9042465.1 hypothetical protein [Chitinophagales bacterium]
MAQYNNVQLNDPTRNTPKNLVYWELGLLTTDFAIEHTLSEYWTLKCAVGYDGNFALLEYKGTPHWLFDAFIETELRYNKFSKQRRIRKNKDTWRNAGSYMGIKYLQYFPTLSIHINENGSPYTASNAQALMFKYGLKRNFWKYFSFNGGLSIGSNFTSRKVAIQTEFDIGVYFNGYK